MLAKANTQNDSLPLDRNVREVVAICATHSLSYGQPNDLVGFMRALHENKHLAMNFWSLVARLSNQGPNPNQPDWILATIVEGVTGRTRDEVRAAGPAHRVLVTRLASMLAGEDVLEPLPAELPSAPPVAATEEMLPARKARQADVAEITPRQSRTSAALAAASKTREAAPIEPITNPAWLREERMRIVLEPEQPVHHARSAAAGARASQDEPDIVIPLSSYAETSHESIFTGGRLAAALIVLLLIALGIWIVRHRDSDTIQNLEASIHSGYDSAVAGVKGTRPTSSSSSSQPSAATAPVAPTPDASTTLPSSAPAPEASGQSHPASGAPPTRTEPISQPKTTSPVPAPIERRAANKEALVAAEASAAEASAEEAALPEESGSRVSVPPATMEKNLISSRVPIFPEAAKASGIEGRVIMQAYINKDGSIGHLRVISGDPALRRAATDAVSTWRYTPYLVNGQPVDVSTTISVDFFDSH